VIKPTQDANKVIDNLGRSKGPDQLERGMKDAQEATEALGDETADTARKIEREFRDTYKGVGNDADDAFGKAKRGAQDFKEESVSTGKEVAASFSSVEDAIGGVQELAANALGGFGPAGVAAGLVAAAGIGLVTSGLQAQQEEADKLKEAFAGLYQGAVEEGRNYLDAAQIIGEVQSLIFDPERAGEYKRLLEEASRIGVDSSTYIRAIAGDEDAINVALEIGNAKRAERQEWAEKNLLAERETGEVTDEQGAAMDGVLAKLDTRQTLTEENKAAAELALQVEKDLDEATAEGNRKAKQAVDERGGALQAYADLAGSIPNPVLVPDIDATKAERKLQDIINRRRSEIEIGVRYRNGKEVMQ
jgi:hypothetical protein